MKLHLWWMEASQCVNILFANIHTTLTHTHTPQPLTVLDVSLCVAVSHTCRRRLGQLAVAAALGGYWGAGKKDVDAKTEMYDVMSSQTSNNRRNLGGLGKLDGNDGGIHRNKSCQSDCK